MLDKRTIYPFLVLIVVAHASVARAGLIALNPVDEGTIVLQQGGTSTPYIHENGLSWIGQNVHGPADSPILSFRSAYTIFDLSAVNTTIQNASLQLDVGSFGFGGSLINLTSIDFITAENLSNEPIGVVPNGNPFGSDLVDDINFGVDRSTFNFTKSFGTLDSISGPGVHNIQLSSFGLDSVNNESGYLAIGLAWVHPSNGPGEAFNNTTFNTPAQLRLNTAAQPAPVPSSLWLLGAAILLIPLRARIGRPT